MRSFPYHVDLTTDPPTAKPKWTYDKIMAQRQIDARRKAKKAKKGGK